MYFCKPPYIKLSYIQKVHVITLQLSTPQQRNQNVTSLGKFDSKKMTMSRKCHILIRKTGRLVPNKHVSLLDIRSKCPLAQYELHAAKI